MAEHGKIDSKPKLNGKMAKSVRMKRHSSQPAIADWVKTLEDYMNLQLVLCSKLEAIADSLPTLTDTNSAYEASQSLVTLLRTVHKFEEGIVFPQLQKDVRTRKDLTETVKRLKNEHLGDEDFAEDVSAELTKYLYKQDHQQAESLGWMLRGLFENLRRHIAFEREHILPLAQEFEKDSFTG